MNILESFGSHRLCGGGVGCWHGVSKVTLKEGGPVSWHNFGYPCKGFDGPKFTPSKGTVLEMFLLSPDSDMQKGEVWETEMGQSMWRQWFGESVLS